MLCVQGLSRTAPCYMAVQTPELLRAYTLYCCDASLKAAYNTSCSVQRYVAL